MLFFSSRSSRLFCLLLAGRSISEVDLGGSFSNNWAREAQKKQAGQPQVSGSFVFPMTFAKRFLCKRCSLSWSGFSGPCCRLSTNHHIDHGKDGALLSFPPATEPSCSHRPHCLPHSRQPRAVLKHPV